MTDVPPPDPEVMKNCIVNTGDLLIFQFDIDMRDAKWRPMTADEIMRHPQELIDLIPDDILRQRLSAEQLRKVRPHLVPDEPPAAAG